MARCHVNPAVTTRLLSLQPNIEDGPDAIGFHSANSPVTTNTPVSYNERTQQ